MLQPRETDIPALFLVFVVLPLVTYILLGKWNEAAKKKERISLLAERAAQEAFGVEATAAVSVIPVVTLPNNGVHLCARCYGPATTRCSRCKSVRYCSGKCQIIHWRQVHKHECQPLGNNSSSSCSTSALGEEFHGGFSSDDGTDSQNFRYNVGLMSKNATAEDSLDSPTDAHKSPTIPCTTMDTSGVPITGRRSTDRQACEKGSGDMLRTGEEDTLECADQASKSRITCLASSCTTPSKKAHMRHKLRESDSALSEHHFNSSSGCNNGHIDMRGTKKENCASQRESDQSTEMRNYYGTSNSFNLSNNGVNESDFQMDSTDGENLFRGGNATVDEATGLNCFPERALTKRVSKAKTESQSLGTKRHKSPKRMMKTSREHAYSDRDRNGQTADESKVARVKDSAPLQESNGITSKGIMRMIGLKKLSQLEKQDPSALSGDKHKKVKMLFPYEEFVKFFQCEVFNLSPRGLLNCGNSCYANAVLQCLTCTKPLTVYLLRRSHSNSCCVRDWCLMCELEQHVMMLRESGGPLSPSRILSHMRRINCQIGDGSQEDAHEFLRLLVASMQSICLDGLGGENVVDPRLQETTFIQHTFGGRLRSKVKCLRCHHESERFENIMDLTLEIFGWVESLEDALTQFTSPEDLDGENMYRCGRCVSYVRAWKQLSIQEAPNVLTIVLKRFQEGNYGKINKCITFPDMLDMIPFMTGTDDIPPLYMLYAVVVHLDTLNASFSGHYISYVKDLQGNWFRIDDTEVQPVSARQVMSEGAYMLFYMRSAPRLARTCSRKTSQHQEPRIPKYWPSRADKYSKLEPRKPNQPCVSQEPSSDHTTEMDVHLRDFISGGVLRSTNRNRLQTLETCAESIGMEFSDATSSDWSLFTSSDEASFTTESTRDSFSTVDYSDGVNVDPVSSIFGPTYAPEYSSRKTVACSMFSGSMPQTRFFIESKGTVTDSYLPTQSVDRLWRGNMAKNFCTDSNCCIRVGAYANDHLNGPQTSLLL